MSRRQLPEDDARQTEVAALENQAMRLKALRGGPPIEVETIQIRAGSFPGTPERMEPSS